jgi:hypothetical protein
VSDLNTLIIWHGQRRVGQLWRNPVGAIRFHYDPAWVAGTGFAISRAGQVASWRTKRGERISRMAH